MKDSPPSSSELESKRVSRFSLPVILLTVFVDLIGFGIIIPLLPFYADTLGGSPAILGVLIASFSLMGFVFAPILGRISDKVGRRPVILTSLAVATAGHLTFALADSLFLLLLSRIVAGIGSANLSVAQAYVADSTRPEERTKWMGRIGASMGVGFIIGPTIGGFLSEYGFAVPGFAAAGIAFSNLILAFFILPETLPPSIRRTQIGTQRAMGGFIAGFRRPIIGALLLVFFVISFAFSTIPVVYPLLAIEFFNLGPRDMSFIFIYIGAIRVLIQSAVIGRLVRWVREEKLLITGVFLMMAAIFVTPFIPNLVVYILLLGLLASGVSITYPLVSSMISKRSAASEQGTMLGLAQSVSSGASVPGPIIGGFIFEFLGLAMPFIMAAALMLVGFALSIKVWLHSRLSNY